MKTVELTPAQEQILREQVIDAERPGSVLRDFQTILGFVGTKGLKAAGKYNLLPINVIGELDQRLTRPLRLELKRPQLRSHPYLQGLHLLFRASGLSRIEGAGEKARLVVDAPMLDQWNRLNATEQYFTLLETWLRFGRAEMIGERDRMFDSLLFDCLQTWRRIPAKGIQKKVMKDTLVVGRHAYQLALMDLFGLVTVEQSPKPMPSWTPTRIAHLPFGDAVLALLTQQVSQPWRDLIVGEEDQEEEEEGLTAERQFGKWQPLFQPYFPEWRANLTLPEAASRKGTFVFRVSLGQVWRFIAMPAGATLDKLVDWILRSVGFDSDHLYEFTYRDRFGATVQVCHPAIDEGPWTDEIHVGELPLEPGQSMKLVYDFGDNWKFDVTLQRIEPPGAKIKAPRILEKHGRAPEQYPDWDE